MQSLKRRLKVSSKGQVVIPKDLRNSLDINKGDELVLEYVNDGVLLKRAKRNTSRHALRGLINGEDIDSRQGEEILEKASCL